MDCWVFPGSSREFAIRSVLVSILANDLLHITHCRNLADIISKETLCFETPQHIQEAAHRTCIVD